MSAGAAPTLPDVPPADPIAARWIPLAALLLHLATVHRYGVFRDELYYVACGRHLAWGYVDHPPLVALVAAAATGLLGTSLVGLRLFAALCGAATAWTAARLARELGGRAYAQRLAALCVTLGGNMLFVFQVLSMNALDHLVWALAFLLAARALRTGSTRAWLALGLVLGIGLENKLSVLFLGAGFALGLLLFRRDVLARRGPWLAALVAGLLFLPHVAWQAAHGFPTREFVANARARKMVAFEPLDFLARTVPEAGAGSALVMVAGLIGFALLRPRRVVLPLATAFVGVLLFLASTRSKPYYAAPAFVVAFAAGGAWLESLGPRAWARVARSAAAGLAVVGGLALAPFAKPLLSPDASLAGGGDGARELGPAVHVGEALGRLPQALGLPPALSGHNSYHLFGPGDWDGSVLVVIDDDEERLLELFESVERAGTTDCTDCMPYEDGLPIWICRRLRTPVDALWPSIRVFV